MPSDLRTRAIVLRRTNYGESDRILNLITPEGKLAVLARGVRKEKSRLAGGIELFSVADVVVHQGRSSLGTLTGAKMLHFYGSNIMSDLSRLEFASSCLKKIDRVSEHTENPEFFSILEQVLAGLHQNLAAELISTWFTFNLAHASGEEINLLCDVSGAKLQPDQRYAWDSFEAALKLYVNGPIGADEIKLARLMLANKLQVVSNVNRAAEIARPLAMIAQTFA